MGELPGNVIFVLVVPPTAAHKVGHPGHFAAKSNLGTEIYGAFDNLLRFDRRFQRPKELGFVVSQIFSFFF
jgi:hypothetical protein